MTDRVPPKNIRHYLKNSTAALHESIDVAFSRFTLSDRRDYIAFLAIHAAALLPLEHLMERHGIATLLPDWHQRCRSDALMADLNCMGSTLPGTLGSVAWAVPSPATLMGMAYVLEGSRLGGSILLRQVRQSADPAVRQATAYLGHGAGSKLWPSFLALLETSDAVRSQPHEAVAGAQQAFDAFQCSLQTYEHQHGAVCEAN